MPRASASVPKLLVPAFSGTSGNQGDHMESFPHHGGRDFAHVIPATTIVSAAEARGPAASLRRCAKPRPRSRTSRPRTLE